tara:strand:+ start:2263 stop:2445 length:183 start_codon:yes stop_codon:yes gene_type:complete
MWSEIKVEQESQFYLQEKQNDRNDRNGRNGRNGRKKRSDKYDRKIQIELGFEEYMNKYMN